MSRRCEDCGCILNGGICSNCHEELYIETYQYEDMEDKPMSKEWNDAVGEQLKDVHEKEKKRREKEAEEQRLAERRKIMEENDEYMTWR